MYHINMRKFYREDLQNQYEHDTHFRSRVDHSEVAYSAFLKKISQEGSILDNVHENMLEKFIGDDSHPTYFFYGHLQPPPNRGEKQLLLYLVKNFQPQPGVPFTFVYFNHHTPSSDYYFKFKCIFDLLPLRLIQKMRNFYLVKPYFYIKAYDMLGQSNRVFAETYRTLENCQELVKKENYKVHDFVTFVPEEISEEFPTHLKRRPSLLTYRINVEGQNMSEEQIKEKRDFESSVNALITKEVYKLENYELGELGVPMVLQLLVGYFKQKPQSLLQEGIFRKSVSIDQQNETLQQLSGRNFGYLQQITNPHLIASLIKKFFSNLKQPIIPFPLFDKLMHDQGVSNKRQFVKQHIHSLPILNFLSLMFVIDFLRKDVIPVEKETKMSAHNLAICFSPAFMRSEKPSFADIANASKAVMVTEILINDFDEVFGQEHQRNKLFEKSIMDRRINIKKNLKEELDINIDDRTSEEVNSNIFLLEQGDHHESHKLEPSPPKQQHHPQYPKQQHQFQKNAAQNPQQPWGVLITKPIQPVTLSKEVYKTDLHPQRPPKEESLPPKSAEINIGQQPPIQMPTLSHQVKSESFLLQQLDDQEERPKPKKSKFDLVQLILKNENKLQKSQLPPAPPSDPSSTGLPSQMPSVVRSSINFHYQSGQN